MTRGNTLANQHPGQSPGYLFKPKGWLDLAVGTKDWLDLAVGTKAITLTIETKRPGPVEKSAGSQGRFFISPN